MEELDLEMESVLRRARAATEPSQTQVSRLLAGVQLELAGAGLATPNALRPAARGASGQHRVALGQRASRFGARVRFVSWGALTAAAGFWLGIQYERGTAPLARPPTLQPVQAPTRAVDAPTQRDPAEEEAARAAPIAAEPVPGERLAPTPSAAEPASLARHTVRHRQRALQAPEQLNFRQVLDRLRRAERAERSGAPELALTLLDEIDQGAAPTILREERLLTAVLALCDQGEVTRARQRARELSGARNDSIYASRLRESCAVSEDEP